MIGIGTLLFDVDGHKVIHDEQLKTPEETVLSRRTSSTKTLDGGAFVSDFGFAVTDNDIVVIAFDLSKDEVDDYKRMIRLHSKFVVCNTDGAFHCVLSTVAYNSNELTLRFLVVGDA